MLGCGDGERGRWCGRGEGDRGRAGCLDGKRLETISHSWDSSVRRSWSSLGGWGCETPDMPGGAAVMMLSANSASWSSDFPSPDDASTMRTLPGRR